MFINLSVFFLSFSFAPHIALTISLMVLYQTPCITTIRRSWSYTCLMHPCFHLQWNFFPTWIFHPFVSCFSCYCWFTPSTSIQSVTQIIATIHRFYLKPKDFDIRICIIYILQIISMTFLHLIIVVSVVILEGVHEV